MLAGKYNNEKIGSHGFMEKEELFVSETIHCDSFEIFEQKINEINVKVAIEWKKEPMHGFHPILYRGQSDSSLLLETTLDRISNENISVRRYYEDVSSCQKEIATLIGKEWKIGKTDFKNYLFFSGGKGDMPMYEMMVYMRHHSFPSPLLDWTRSPYIAAFFAFNDLYKMKRCDNASIFLYLENGMTACKTHWGGETFIHSLGPNVVAHKRHFLQQSEYTICLREAKGEPDNFYYAKHEDVLSRNDPSSDIVKKFTIPFTEQNKILKRLNTMNVNAHSLYGSDEGVFHNLAVKAFISKNL